MKLLEARVSLVPVILAGRASLSQLDVAAYVALYEPTDQYHLFHDAVSLLECISDAFIGRQEVLTEMYQADRVAINNMQATMVASFRITLPTVLGLVKDGSAGSAPRRPLPAVKDYATWNNHDAESGVKQYIERGLDDEESRYVTTLKLRWRVTARHKI